MTSDATFVDIAVQLRIPLVLESELLIFKKLRNEKGKMSHRWRDTIPVGPHASTFPRESRSSVKQIFQFFFFVLFLQWFLIPSDSILLATSIHLSEQDSIPKLYSQRSNKKYKTAKRLAALHWSLKSTVHNENSAHYPNSNAFKKQKQK